MDRLTVDSDVAHGVSPVLLLVRLAIIGAQLACEAAEDGIALRQDLAVQLDDWDGGERIQLRDLCAFVRGVLVEAVACVVVADVRVLNTKNLSVADQRA